MCIRDRAAGARRAGTQGTRRQDRLVGHRRDRRAGRAGKACLLYTSDAADERSSVDLGGRRIIKKKKKLYYASDALRTKTKS